MTQSVVVTAQVRLGASNPYTGKISSEAKEAFDEAFKSRKGVQYEPVAVSSQIVAGTVYRFFCNKLADDNTTKVAEYPSQGVAIVHIYKPLRGPARVRKVQPIDE